MIKHPESVMQFFKKTTNKKTPKTNKQKKTQQELDVEIFTHLILALRTLFKILNTVHIDIRICRCYDNLYDPFFSLCTFTTTGPTYTPSH